MRLTSCYPTRIDFGRPTSRSAIRSINRAFLVRTMLRRKLISNLQTSADGQDDRVVYGVSAMQGWRISMEDAHATVLDLQAEHDGQDFRPATVENRLSFFGVYDGHGGDKVALFAGENVHKIIARQEAFKRKDYEQALKDGFLATDRAILNGKSQNSQVVGYRF